MINNNFAYKISANQDLSKDENLIKNLSPEAKKVMAILGDVEDFTIQLRSKLNEEFKENK